MSSTSERAMMAHRTEPRRGVPQGTTIACKHIER